MMRVDGCDVARAADRGIQRPAESGRENEGHCANVVSSGEFVVDLVSAQIAEETNLTCMDAPPDVSEVELVKLETAPSTSVKPPRLQESPVCLECRFVTSLSFTANQAVIFGRAGHVHVSDELVIDGPNCVIDSPGWALSERCMPRSSIRGLVTCSR